MGKTPVLEDLRLLAGRRYVFGMRRSENRICSVDGCDREIEAKGMCRMHYKAARRALLPRQRALTQPPHPCAADGCTTITTRIYCNAHEKRLARYGDANYYPPRLTGVRCAAEGCDHQAVARGFCHHHDTMRNVHGDPAAGRQMLSVEAINLIRRNEEMKSPQQLAEQFDTTPSTVVAVRRGRNWGYLRT